MSNYVTLFFCEEILIPVDMNQSVHTKCIFDRYGLTLEYDKRSSNAENRTNIDFEKSISSLMSRKLRNS